MKGSVLTEACARCEELLTEGGIAANAAEGDSFVRAHVAHCAACRSMALAAALMAYDGTSGAATPLDDLARRREVYRLVDLSKARRDKAGAGGMRRRAMQLSVAISATIGVAAVAVAAAFVARNDESPDARPANAAPPVTAAAPLSRAPVLLEARLAPAGSDPRRSDAAESQTTPGSGPGPAPASRRTQEAPAVAAPLPQAPARAETIHDLLSEAQRSRAARDWRAAAQAYALILQRYGSDPRAHAVYLSLAEIELEHLGDSESALRAADAYLEVASAGALAPEALYLRARALGALERRGDELDALRAYLRRFPSGLQQEQVRRRLEELESRLPAGIKATDGQ